MKYRLTEALVSGDDFILDQPGYEPEWSTLDSNDAATVTSDLEAIADQSYTTVVDGDGATVFVNQSYTTVVDQSYIMAELTDEGHNAIEGYERSRCVLDHIPGRRTRLHWAGRDGTDLAGRTVRLRLCVRDARVYAVSSAEKVSQEKNEIFSREG